MKNGEVWGAKNSGNFNCEENGEHFLVLLAEIFPWKIEMLNLEVSLEFPRLEREKRFNRFPPTQIF